MTIVNVTCGQFILRNETILYISLVGGAREVVSVLAFGLVGFAIAVAFGTGFGSTSLGGS